MAMKGSIETKAGIGKHTTSTPEPSPRNSYLLTPSKLCVSSAPSSENDVSAQLASKLRLQMYIEALLKVTPRNPVPAEPKPGFAMLTTHATTSSPHSTAGTYFKMWIARR